MENTNRNIHGALRIHPSRPHHFQFEDGTNCFLMGYEADRFWALGFNDPGLKKVLEFIGLMKQ